ncbi:MAG TPA: hypothetical protein VHC47_00030, partial [Mucilaginibacter sp.]|nr:hypothetical protein [Mucilaginibacter sp.]
MMNTKPFGFILVLVLLSYCAKAQSPHADTLAYSSAVQWAVRDYNATIADQSQFNNGTEYRLDPPAYRGSPCFMDARSCIPATIRYNGTWYKNVPVLYDMHTDQMVSEVRDSMFVLRQDKVSDVVLEGHHFILLGSQPDQNISGGYYDRLYDGRSEVLVKRVRTI